MAIILENAHASLVIQPEQATYGFYSQADERALTDLRVSVSAFRHGRLFTSLTDDWGIYTYDTNGSDLLTLVLGPDEHKLQYTLEFHLLPAVCAFTLKLRISNQGPAPVFLEKISLAKKIARARTTPDTFLGIHGSNIKDRLLLSNGWQSWSPTRVYRHGMMQFRSAFPPMIAPMVEYPGTMAGLRDYEFVSDGFGVIGDSAKGCAVVAGFLSQTQYFGSVGINLSAGKPNLVEVWESGEATRLDSDHQVVTDPLYFELTALDDNKVIDHYYHCLSQQTNARVPAGSPAGWCSWYQFGQNINETTLLENLNHAKANQATLPIQLFQIDDGFETKVGDWFSLKPGFENGLGALSDAIRENGYQPGLWLAPFIIENGTKLIRDHPDYLLRGLNGQPVNAGYGWNGMAKALDMTHPGAFDYVMTVIDTAVRDWKFPYLKLDFLYAAALRGRRMDARKSGAQVLTESMQAIRKVAGEDVFLLGCGMPLLSGAGLVDGMRVSADVAPSWEPKFLRMKSVFKKELTMPAARNALINDIMRANMHHKLWLNDPDCLILRDVKGLSDHEAEMLVTVIAMTGGNTLLSDHLPDLSAERRRWFEWLLPLIDQPCQVLDYWTGDPPELLKLNLTSAAGDYHLLACLNWKDKSREVELSPSTFELQAGQYWVRDIWKRLNRKTTVDQSLWLGKLEKRSALLLAVRPVTHAVTYLGSDLHISSGLGIASVEHEPGKVNFTINLGRQASGAIDIFSERPIVQAVSSQGAILPEKLSDDVYRFPIQIEKSDRLTLSY